MNRPSFLRPCWAPITLGACLLLGCTATTQNTPSASASAPRTLGVDTKNFDPSVRPQDDFYRYVNGTWLKTTQIPPDKGEYGAFIELRDKSEAALRVLIEEAAAQQDKKSSSDAPHPGREHRGPERPHRGLQGLQAVAGRQAGPGHRGLHG